MTAGNLTNSPAAAQAFTRFGLGGRPDDAIPADPIGWLMAQITGPDQAPSGGVNSAQGLALARAFLAAPLGSTQRASLSSQLQTTYSAEVQSFLAYAVTTKTPFRERLVWFWSNHFAVMAENDSFTRACAGAYIREAIRPGMTGTVAQLLQATILHPAMLTSLNAETSVGPQSPMAISYAKRGAFLGINENLGRETLELYSLGYNQGYVQADVDAMAYLLSGMDINVASASSAGAFYNLQKQQPGNVTLMGKTYPCTQSGLASALQMLGTHPNTYLHLATKLVTHFVSDTPSPADITTVYNAFATTGGSLPAAHRALVGLQNAWIPLQKLRTPTDLVIAALRATGTTAASMPQNILGSVRALGQVTWCPEFPVGWSDLAGDWNGPASMMLRADWAWHFATFVNGMTPSQIALASVAPFLSARTSSAIAGAASTQEQNALLLSSPEFQRR